MAYQALSMVLLIVYNLMQGGLTTLCIWGRKGPHNYAGGKRTPDGETHPPYNTPHYWFRWFLAPGWMPNWAWTVATIFVCASSGVGSGFFFWIVNDYTNNYWLSIASFFLIIPPVLAAGWALVFFVGQSFAGAIVMGFFWFAAAGVNVALTIVYPVYAQMQLPYWTYAWLAFGLGTCAQFLWSAYVLGLTCAVAYYNSGKSMESHLAADETLAERAAAVAVSTNVDKIVTASLNASSTVHLENMQALMQAQPATLSEQQQQLLAQQQQQTMLAASRSVHTAIPIGRNA